MFLNTNYYNCYFVRDAEVAGSNPVASTMENPEKQVVLLKGKSEQRAMPVQNKGKDTTD